MTSLTLVVGQRRTVLVASALLILACDAQPQAGSATDAGTTSLDQPAIDAAVATPDAAADDTALAPDANLGPPAMDAGRPVGLRPARDGGAWARDASADAPVLTGGGPPLPWRDLDYGVGTKGETTATATSFTVVAAGDDIGGASDSFHFVAQSWDNDGDVIARIATVDTTDPTSKAGVMFRGGGGSGAAEGAPNVFFGLLGDGSGGGRLQARTSQGGATTIVQADPGARVGQYLRLSRVGTTFTAYRSSNRVTWTRVGSVDVQMSDVVAVGLATSGRVGAQPVQVGYSYLTLDNLHTEPLARPWEALDLGAIGTTAKYVHAQLVLTGAGTPATGTDDSVSAVVQPVSGSQRVTLRSQTNTAFGLTFREGLTSTASRAAAFVSIGFSGTSGQLEFRSRSQHGALATTGARRMDVGALYAWLRLEKLAMGGGDRFVGSYSADGGATWTVLDTVDLEVAEPLLMGVYVEGESSARTTTGRFDDFFAVAIPPDGGADGEAPITTADAAAPRAEVSAPATDAALPDGGAAD